MLAFCDHFSASSSGGAERVAAEIYGRLARDHGVEITVLSVLRPGHHPLDLPGVEVVAVRGHDLSGIVGAELLVAPGLRRRGRALFRQVRPNVLHGNGLHFHGTAVAARIARTTGTPLVTTAHLGDLAALGLLTRAAGGLWDQTLGRYAVAGSTGCVAVSTAVAEHLASLNAPADAVRVAPNGVDHQRFHTHGRDQVGEAGPLRAVFVGRLIANKGPSVAIDAVAEAHRAGREVTLTVLGDGPLRASLLRRAAKRGIAEHVRFVGHVDDVATWLRSADVLLRPSLTEGLPLAVLEAMACGLPVICSTVAGNTEVVTHGVNGLHAAPRDVAGTAAGLVSLADDRPRLQRLAAAAVRVAADHTWDHSAAIHLSALTAAIGTHDLELPG